MNKQKGIASMAVMIVMLVMAVALPITTKLVQQNQENRSKAAGTCKNYCEAGSFREGTEQCLGTKTCAIRSQDVSGCPDVTCCTCNDCVASTTRCSVDGKLQTCSFAHTWNGGSVCPEGQSCKGNACVKDDTTGDPGTTTISCTSNGGSCVYSCPSGGVTISNTDCVAPPVCCKVTDVVNSNPCGGINSPGATCMSQCIDPLNGWVGTTYSSTDCSGNLSKCCKLPTTTTYDCSAKACSSNYGCMRNDSFISSDAACTIPIGTVNRTVDQTCPKRNGAGGGNDNACTATTACTSYSAGTWSACSNGYQTRTVTGYPTGCSDGTVTKPATSQTCSSTSTCVTTCPAGKVMVEKCLEMKGTPVDEMDVNVGKIGCSSLKCSTCGLSSCDYGDTQCLSNGVLQKCNKKSGDFYIWNDVADCGLNNCNTSGDGSCGNLSTATYYCDNTSLYGCKNGRKAVNTQDLPGIFKWDCLDNTRGISVPCSMNKCTPTGNTRCNGDYVQVCRSSGLWENTVCVGGEKCITNSANKGVCGGPCTAGQTQCSGNSLQTCTSNGTWGTASPCGSNKVCTSNGINSASCIDGPSGCSIGTLRCFNNLLQQCDTNGTWSKQLADCSSTNKKCVVFNNGGSGTCESITTSCTPNVKKCSGGNVLQTCNSAGNAWIDTDCGFDKTCTPSGTNNASCVVNTGTGGGTDSCSRCNTSLASRGDGNCDGKINELDFSVWLSEFQKGTKSKADFNCNGSVGIEDFSIWNTNFR